VRLKAEFLLGLGEGVDRELEIGARVGGADLGADAGGALRDDGIKKADDVDAFFEHAGGEFLGERGVAEHHGHDGMRAGFEGETRRRQAGAEELGVLCETVAERGRACDEIERGDRRGGDGGREGIGEEVGAGTLAEEIDDFLFPLR